MIKLAVFLVAAIVMALWVMAEPRDGRAEVEKSWKSVNEILSICAHGNTLEKKGYCRGYFAGSSETLNMIGAMVIFHGQESYLLNICLPWEIDTGQVDADLLKKLTRARSDTSGAALVVGQYLAKKWPCE